MKRAYAVLNIKATGPSADGKRRFTGIATTPTADTVGDIVEPKGAEFKLPIPLCWMHNTRDPVGWVTAAKVTDKGIEIEGEIANIAEPASLKDRLDTAWAMLTNKLVQGLSIGFKPVEYSRIDGTYSYRYTKWLWLELSPVTVPANQDCSITDVNRDGKTTGRAGSGGRPVVRLESSPAGRAKPVIYLDRQDKRPGVVYLDRPGLAKRRGVVYLDGHGAGVAPGPGRRRVVYLR